MTVVSSSLEISWSLLFISSAGGMSILLMSTLVMMIMMIMMMIMIMRSGKGHRVGDGG